MHCQQQRIHPRHTHCTGKDIYVLSPENPCDQLLPSDQNDTFSTAPSGTDTSQRLPVFRLLNKQYLNKQYLNKQYPNKQYLNKQYVYTSSTTISRLLGSLGGLAAQNLSPLLHGIRKHVEDLDRVVPADAGIGNADAVLEGVLALLGDLLVA